MPEPLISNVSDTACWMAAERAAESVRPDALFNDPFANRLAGDRGRAIAATAPRLTRNGWPSVTRTKLIDDLVAESVKSGCDRVLNLATLRCTNRNAPAATRFAMSTLRHRADADGRCGTYPRRRAVILNDIEHVDSR